MADRPPLNKTFEKPLDRETYEHQQKLLALSEEQRRRVVELQEENRKALEKKQHELEQRKQEDIENEKKLIDRETPQLILTPNGPTNYKRTEQEKQALAEQRVSASHKAELDALEKDLNKTVVALIASYAQEKQRELDEDRQHIRELAEQKRDDREKRDAYGPERETSKEAQARSDDLNRRIAERIRKAKERDERNKNRDDRERD